MTSSTDLPASWVGLHPPTFPHEFAFDPARQTPVLLAQGPGLRQNELWAWDGQRFQLAVADLFPDQPPGSIHRLMSTVDPAGDRLLVFGATRDGVVASPVTGAAANTIAPARLPDADERSAAHRWVFAAVVLGGAVLFVARDGSVFAREGDTLTPVHGPVADLAEDRELWSVVVDRDRDALAATTVDGRLHTFTLDAGWLLVADHGVATMRLAWDPKAAGVAMLCGAPAPSGDRYVRRRGWLRSWDEQPGDQPPDEHLVPLHMGSHLVFDQARDQWLVSFGATVWAARPGAAWTQLPQPGNAEFGSDLTATATRGGPLRLWCGAFQDTMTLRGDVWVPGPRGKGHGDHLVAAVPDGFVWLAGDGSLHHVPDQGEPRELATRWSGLSGLSSRDRAAALCHESDRLVLWDGRAGRLWVFRDAAWTRLPAGPPAGPGVLCATEHGVYCCAGGELWLVAPGDSVARVGVDPDWSAHLLATAGGALWSVSERHVVGCWLDGRFQPLAELPAPVSLTGEDADRVRAGYYRSAVMVDPVTERLLVFGPSGGWSLSLAEATPADAVLPEPTGPAVAAGSTVDAATEPSCYVVELSVEPGGDRAAIMHTFGTLTAALDALDDTLSDEDNEERVLGGATLHLWVVQRGTLTQGIDLRPHLRTGTEAGDRFLTRIWELHRQLADEWDDEVEAELLDRLERWYEGEAEGIARGELRLDLVALRAVVPALAEPVLGADGRDEVTITWDGPHPDPDVFSYVGDDMTLVAGTEDLEG